MLGPRQFKAVLLAIGMGMLPALVLSGEDKFMSSYESAFTEELRMNIIPRKAEILNAIEYFDGGTTGVAIVLNHFGRAFVMLPANLPGPKHRNGPWVIISAFEGLEPRIEVAQGSELAKRLRQYFKIAQRPSDPQVLKRIQAIEKNLNELSPPPKDEVVEDTFWEKSVLERLTK